MNNTDPTSFQSILAGVAKLRKEKAGDETKGEISSDIKANETREQVERGRSPSKTTPVNNRAPVTTTADNSPIINAFNQQRFSDDTLQPGDLTDSDINRKRPFNPAAKGKSVLVSTSQKENPLLNHLKSTNWRYIKPTPGNKILYDYMVRNRSILFLTLSYHKLYQDYIERRMLPLKKNNDNILIFVVDDTNSEDILKDITKLCMFNGFTLLLAFNFQQAAKYIEALNS
ncbi:DNA repair protein RAD10 [Nakaseomyces bracarensis]|uniref:DNA repair protein RAD10 n=1 Tax=Nakaseomyces bracarensis TaxID=273131 RepID=A0ABR4NPH6_9SACH